MIKRWFRVGAVISAFACLVVTAAAQRDVLRAAAGDKFVISAKAGGVNVVDGEVLIDRAGGRTGRLIKGDSIEVGERVSTGADAKAEILLNPGSYIRLGENSSFEFESTDLETLRVRIHSGSAMFEVFSTEAFAVHVNARNSKFRLTESGVYRVDMAAKGSSTLSVWRGFAQAGSSSRVSAKGGRRVEFVNGHYAVVKFDRDDKDDLALWSGERAKILAKTSASLRRDRVRDPLISAFNAGRWNLYNSFGLWVYDPFFGSYCFLPFGYGWSSPYGYWFGRGIWYFNLPPMIYKEPPPPGWRGRGPVTPVTAGTNSDDRKSDPATGRGNRGDDRGRGVVDQPRMIPTEPTRGMPRMIDPIVPIVAPKIPVEDRRKP